MTEAQTTAGRSYVPIDYNNVQGAFLPREISFNQHKY